MNKKILIIGAGGHGKVCADIAKQMNKWSKIQFLDDNVVDRTLSFDIVGKIELDKYSITEHDVFIAIGDNKTRYDYYCVAKKLGFDLPTLVHKTSVISQYCKLGEGSVVMPYVVINANSYIGESSILNTACVVEHDCIIGNYVHISPNATLTGGVEIGDFCWIGASATLINKVKIAKNAIIGAGSVVIRNIDISGVYAGIPVKKL